MIKGQPLISLEEEITTTNNKMTLNLYQTLTLYVQNVMFEAMMPIFILFNSSSTIIIFSFFAI